MAENDPFSDMGAIATRPQPEQGLDRAGPLANPFQGEPQDGGGSAPASVPSSDDPFADMASIPSGTSAKGAFMRSAERGALPAAGGLVGAGAGAETGALIGALGGPLAPITVPVGAFVFGVAGGIGGSMATEKAQDYALSKAPDTWKEALGQDERQQKLDESQHPYASFMGGIAPYALTMRPGGFGGAAAKLPENATAFQRIMANPTTARLFGGAAMGGIELGSEAVHGESPDWTKIAIATGFGTIFNKPMKLNELLTGVGARPFQRFGAAAPAPVTVAQAGDAKVMGPGVTEEVFQGSHEQAPEAAMSSQDAARAEAPAGPPQPDIHDVVRRMEPELFEQYDALSAHRDAARAWVDRSNNPPDEDFANLAQQRGALEEKLAAVPTSGAGRNLPEARRLRAQIRGVQAQETALQARRDAFAAGEGEDTLEAGIARQHLLSADYAMRDLAPQISAAYRRAAEAVSGDTIPPVDQPAPEASAPAPEPFKSLADMIAARDGASGEASVAPVPPQSAGEAPVPPQSEASPTLLESARSPEQQRAAIAADVTQRLMRVGRPEEEAVAIGNLLAARYEARAARMGGALGTAEELYANQGAAIKGPVGRASLPAGAGVAVRPPRQASSRPGAPQSLVAFLRAAGGLKDEGGNLRAAEMHKQFPGLVNNKGGLSLDRAREMAAEAGYLGADTTRAVAETNVNDLLEALDRHPVYSVHDEQRIAAMRDAAERKHFEELARTTPQELADAYRHEPVYEQHEYPEDFFGGMPVDENGAVYFQKNNRWQEEDGIYYIPNPQNEDAPLATIATLTDGKYRLFLNGKEHDFRSLEGAKHFAEDQTGQMASADGVPHQVGNIFFHGDDVSKAGQKYEPVNSSGEGYYYSEDTGETLYYDIKHRITKDGVLNAIVKNLRIEESETEQGFDDLSQDHQAKIKRAIAEDLRDSMRDELDGEDAREFFQREVKKEQRLTVDTPYRGKRRLTASQVDQELAREHRDLERFAEYERGESEGWDKEYLDRRGPEQLQRDLDLTRAEISALTKARERFETYEPSDIRGKPFAPAKMIDAGDRHVVSYAIDERHGAVEGNHVFRVYDKPTDGTPSRARDLGRSLGQVDISRGDDGRWEVNMVHVEPRARGQGVATDLYAAVQKELGIEMSPSGILLPDGYAFWKKRAPEKVQYHQPVTTAEGNNYFMSPKRLGLLGASDDPAASMYQEKFDALPAEAKTPEALRDMFQGARGKIRFVDGQRPVITLMRDANASTFIHETGHQWLEELMGDAAHPAAPDDLKTDAQTVRDWLGVNEGDDLKTRHHEKFARGFEQYMREGIAPSPGLASVFAKFRDWLTSIYQTIKGLGAPINEDIRGVFDRMLSTDPQRTVIAPERAGGPSLADIHEADAVHTESHEAEPAMDRVIAERDRAIVEPPLDIRNEVTSAVSQAEAARGESGPATGTQPAGQDQPSAGGRGQVDGGRGNAGAEPQSGDVGARHSALLGGGGDAGTESDGLREPGDGRADRTGDRNGHGLAPSPAPIFGRRESPFVDKAGNIRVENLTTREDVAQAIHEAADANDDFIGDRRGIITDGQVLDLADALGMDAAKLNQRKIGQAFNAEQVMAARKLLIQSATGVADAMKKAAVGTDEDVMAYAMAKDRHQMIQAQVAGITAEAGRALRAFRSIAGEGSQEAMQADLFIRQATGKTLFQLREEAKLGSELDTPQKVSKFMQDAQKPGFGRMLLEYWINGLISGPATHTTYMIGNTLLSLNKMGPETAAAAAIGALRKARGREGETVQAGEVGAQLRGAVERLPSTLKAALESFAAGVTTELPGEHSDPRQGSLPLQPYGDMAVAPKLDETATYHDAMSTAFGLMRGLRDGIVSGASTIAAGGVEGAPLLGTRASPLGSIPDVTYRGVNVLPVGSAVRLPGRFIAAIHTLFRATNYSASKAALAYRQAVSEGLEGNALAARIGDLRADPTEDMMESARADATALTLMGQGSEFTQALGKLTNTNIFGFPLLKFVSPFVHIASNVIDESLVKRTPLGWLSPELRQDLLGANGTVAQDRAQGRMLVGTAMSLVFGGLAAEGFISGSGPDDPREAAMWRLAGNQAHSVKIGDVWYDVHRLGPLGMLMGVAADMYVVSHLASRGDMLTAAAALQHAYTQNIFDESFMKGPADLIKAVEDPGRYGEGYVRNFAASFVPYSVGIGQIARATDPYSRQARTVMDEIKAKIPGLSTSLYPRRDIWGQPMPNHDALISKGVTAIYETQISRDPVNRAMLEIGIHPGPVDKKIRNVELTPQEYDDYARVAGTTLKQRLDTIVTSPDWRSWPMASKITVMNEVVRQSREAASGYVMMKYPHIAHDSTDAKLVKLQGPKPE